MQICNPWFSRQFGLFRFFLLHFFTFILILWLRLRHWKPFFFKFHFKIGTVVSQIQLHFSASQRLWFHCDGVASRTSDTLILIKANLRETNPMIEIWSGRKAINKNALVLYLKQKNDEKDRGEGMFLPGEMQISSGRVASVKKKVASLTAKRVNQWIFI